MTITLNIEKDLCTKCGKCVKICPAKIFTQTEKIGPIEMISLESCLKCGHCVAACPERAVLHSEFPDEKVHSIDYSLLPTPDQMMLLCKTRRSNRAFSTKPIPQESLKMILEAAHRAPTGSNTQHVKFLLITNPKKLKQVIDFVMEVFGEVSKKLKNPLLRPLIKLTMPNALRYIPVFKRLQKEYNEGGDGILRKATTVIFIYTPKKSRMGSLDANLAYQNGSLMAESLGVSQFYTGFVLNAIKMKKAKLENILGIDGEINAGMALGMPSFRCTNYIDRKDIEVVEMK